MAFFVALPLAALQGFIIFATAWALMRALYAVGWLVWPLFRG